MPRLPDAEFLHTLADVADRETLSRFRIALAIDTKYKEGVAFDPVTAADKEAERAMREVIGREFPDHAVLGEELGSTGGGDVCWVLDPIDGTRPYILGIPVWGTLVGLTLSGRAIAGMMSQPVTRERFWAVDGEAWMSGPVPQRLRTSGTVAIAEAKFHINSPEQNAVNADVDVASLEKHVRLTRYGGECYAFAMLAAGLLDVCLELSLQPYDIAAFVPIIEGAGGVVTTLDGGRPENGGRILASANEVLHRRTLGILMD